MFKNKSILVTGATGSFGKAFIENLIKNHPNFKRLVIFSRDEQKQFEMSKQKKFQHQNLRMFIGDIRDKDRIQRALEGIDIVIHAAALKQVPTAEYNPFEFIKTNIIGTQNLVEACLDSNVEKVVALSTDKASSPINRYGATKLCSDKLVLSANNIKGKRKITFSVIRYGNVMGSRGSVLPFFLKKRATGTITITDKEMTRFNIMMNDCIKMVLWTLKEAQGGEIFVPKIPSFKILDLAKVIAPKCKIKYIGIRPGEKIHEDMITNNESLDTFDLGKYYAIIPNKEMFLKKKNLKYFQRVKKDFYYNSKNNNHFLNKNDLKLIVDQFKEEI